jgi:phage-related protein
MKFYSEVTKKLYESEEELKIVEKAVADEETKKVEAAKAKKADAVKVEEAFKANNDARREYNAKVLAARKMYNDTVAAAKKAFDEAVTAATNAKDTAEKHYDKMLKEFTNKHPEGYHLTLKDGDNVVTISSQAGLLNNSFNKEYNNLLDFMMKHFWEF